MHALVNGQSIEVAGRNHRAVDGIQNLPLTDQQRQLIAGSSKGFSRIYYWVGGLLLLLGVVMLLANWHQLFSMNSLMGWLLAAGGLYEIQAGYVRQMVGKQDLATGTFVRYRGPVIQNRLVQGVVSGARYRQGPLFLPDGRSVRMYREPLSEALQAEEVWIDCSQSGNTTFMIAYTDGRVVWSQPGYQPPAG